MHPALARPNHLPDEPVATDIELLESPTSGGKMSSAAFSVIRRRMLSASSGSERLPVMWDNEEDLDESSEDDDEEDGAGQGKRKNMTVSYTWERAGPFVVVVVSRLSNRPDGRGPGSVQILRRIQPSSGPPDLVYHRLDVVSSPARYLLATQDLLRKHSNHCHFVIQGGFVSLLPLAFDPFRWITFPVARLSPRLVPIRVVGWRAVPRPDPELHGLPG